MKSSLMRGLVAALWVVSLGSMSLVSAFAATPEEQFDQVRAQQQAAYDRIVAEYDQRIAAAPGDVSMQVARCAFIAAAADDNTDIEGAYDALAACEATLEKRFPDQPEAQLFVFKETFGDDAIARGEALQPVAMHWPVALRREFLAAFSNATSTEPDDTRSGELAVAAARLGQTEVVSRAVRHLQRAGKAEEAATLLRTAAPPAWEYEKRRRIDAALALPDKQAGLGEVRRWTSQDYTPDAAQVVRACLRAGDIAGAVRASKALDHDKYGTRDEPLRFDVALAAHDFREAAATIEPTRLDQLRETFRRFVVLLKASPSSLFQPEMLGAATLFACLIVPLLMLPGLLLLPVHYRGLVRRVAGRATTPVFARIHLGHAWYAGAVLVAFSFVGTIAALGSNGTVLVDGKFDPAAVFRMAAWGAGFGLLCMSVVARVLWRRALIGDAALWRATWTRVLGAWALLIVIGVALGAFNHATGLDVDTQQTKLVRALAGAGDSAGHWAILAVVAMLAPIFEELVFRGALLGGLSRHISFAWANTWQALAFAAIHGDPPRFPYYFAMGLFGGWLVKRTGSLAPSIGLHMLNNAVAMGLMIALKG